MVKEETIRIHLATTIGGPDAVSSLDGDRVFHEIDAALKEGNRVLLDFEGITLLITTFLNAAIGQLYGSYDVKFIQDHLAVEHMSDQDKSILRLVTRRAKEYFADKAAMDERISKALGDDPEH